MVTDLLVLFVKSILLKVEIIFTKSQITSPKEKYFTHFPYFQPLQAKVKINYPMMFFPL
jgi:hypothetical protein